MLGFEYFCYWGLSFQENFFNFLLVLVLIFFFFCSLLCCLRIENLITKKLHLNSKSNCRNFSFIWFALFEFYLKFMFFNFLRKSCFESKIFLCFVSVFVFFLTEMG